MGNLYQILATMILCFLCFNVGIMFTWPSSTITIFSSSNTTLHRIMSEGEIALLGSLSSVGAMVGTPLAGIFLDKLGRKKCSLIANLTTVIGWAMISFTNQVEVVLTAVFISGLATASFIVNSAYISEICQESLRGTLTAGIMVFYGFGMLAQYVIGGFMEYWTAAYMNLTLTVIGVCLNCIMKESPLFLLIKGHEEEAANALAFYRQEKPNSKVVQEEIENIKRLLNTEVGEDESPEEMKLTTEKPELKVKEKLSAFQFLKKSKSTRKAIFVTMFLMTSSVFQGLPVLQVYAVPLFAQAVPVMSVTLSSVLMAVITVVVGLIAAVLTDILGRKPLMLYGSIGSGVLALILGTLLQFEWAPSWFNAVIIYLFTIAYTVGAGTVPYVLCAEVFLPEIKNLMMMVVLEWPWVCNFLILIIFNPLVSAIGLGPVFYIFAGVCAISAAFTLFFLPETMGVPSDKIQELFVPKKNKQYP